MRSSEDIPFAIDIKGGDKRQGELKEHHDRGSSMMTGGVRKSMSIAIKDKGGDCWPKG